MDCDAPFLLKVMNSAKDCVCGLVATSTLPPSFDDASIVAEDPDVLLMWLAYKTAKRSDEELEANGFGPLLSIQEGAAKPSTYRQ